MNTPIKREDIKTGDRVRRTLIEEYVAEVDGQFYINDDYTYELIERPVQLPTERGHYVDKYDGWAYLGKDGTWTDSFAYGVEPSVIASRAPLARLRPVAEVAAEVLAEVRKSILNGGKQDNSAFGQGAITIPLTRNIAAIAAKFGVTE